MSLQGVLTLLVVAVAAATGGEVSPCERCQLVEEGAICGSGQVCSSGCCVTLPPLREGEVCDSEEVDRKGDCGAGLYCVVADRREGLTVPWFTCQRRECPYGYASSTTCTAADFRSGACKRVAMGCSVPLRCRRMLNVPEGQHCDQGEQCAPGLACCYPCGYQGCRDICRKVTPCTDPRFCTIDGCPILV